MKFQYLTITACVLVCSALSGCQRVQNSLQALTTSNQTQQITIATQPAAAVCKVTSVGPQGQKLDASINPTPQVVTVYQSSAGIEISCSKINYSSVTVNIPLTEGRYPSKVTLNLPYQSNG